MAERVLRELQGDFTQRAADLKGQIPSASERATGILNRRMNEAQVIASALGLALEYPDIITGYYQ